MAIDRWAGKVMRLSRFAFKSGGMVGLTEAFPANFDGILVLPGFDSKNTLFPRFIPRLHNGLSHPKVFKISPPQCSP